MNTRRTQTLRIFISSPGDVAEERRKAEQVIDSLQRWYGDAVDLRAVLWENLPLEVDSYTAPVRSCLPNPWGFHDMHGNVYEWCRDAMDLEDANYPAGPVTDPLVTRGPYRVVRGGGFYDAAAGCRSAHRNAFQPADRCSILGLRPALVPSVLPVQYSP